MIMMKTKKISTSMIITIVIIIIIAKKFKISRKQLNDFNETREVTHQL